MKLRFLSVLTFVIVAPTMVIGCASRESATNDETSETSLESQCTGRWLAALAKGDCSDIHVSDGTWEASPAFLDAPRETGICVYTWSGQGPGAPDVGTLFERLPKAAVTAVCDDDSVVDDADFVEVGELPSVPPSVGAVGCDVCGIQRDNKAWVVLPPELAASRIVQVPLTNGRVRNFAVQASPNARRVTLSLPPPPAGSQYLDGPVAVF